MDTPLPPSDTRTETYGITWGVRASFLAYIRGASDGSIELSGDAAFTPEGAIHFPFARLEGNESDDERWIRCGGGALFQAHFGMLRIPLQNLTVRVVPGGATLLSEQSDGSLFPIANVELSDPEITADGVVWAAAPVALNEPGSRYFGSNYPEGTPMDPLLIRLPPLA